MRYIETTTLNCQVYASQRQELNKIKSEIESDYNIKIPLSELVRRALEFGIPVIDKDRTFAIELIG
ncbi:hypothetical protein [Methanobacterium sp. SMA-27]|uniref:hypothetical protein n=1 Tax=Methanobacterium sp. SMA-27 TaxID=1495336 RepID=UPI00064EE82B|nr:hypothetical protein [Methanobacterium sp. SMA-27]